MNHFTTTSRPTTPPSRWLGLLSLFLLLITTASAQKKDHFENPKLQQAHTALQAWKKAIRSDPFNFTSNWKGQDVCSYNGVFCAASLSNSSVRVVAGIDLNHAGIAGHLPEELGQLSDLALLHLNSNRFHGSIPITLANLRLLFELNLSNNLFAGQFPDVVLLLPSLKFLDLRFNEFEGSLPNNVFEKDFDAIFLNDNRFKFGIPENVGNSPVSVLVLANNDLGGCIPSSIGRMGEKLNEIILMNDNLTGCLPREIGMLKKVTVFDVSFNRLKSRLPDEIGDMKSVEQLNVGHNKLTGEVPESICDLLRLRNFTYSYNYFTGEPPKCGGGRVVEDGRQNCMEEEGDQRRRKDCEIADAKEFDCSKSKCGGTLGGQRGKRRRRAGYPPSPKFRGPHPSLKTPPPPNGGDRLNSLRKLPVRPPPAPKRSIGPWPKNFPSPPPPCGGEIVLSPPPPSLQHESPPPPPPPSLLPPIGGFSYASPPPPVIPVYD